MPERIQLRRTKGWRKPEGAIVVSRPSRWGNPFRPCLATRRGEQGQRREGWFATGKGVPEAGRVHWDPFGRPAALRDCVELFAKHAPSLYTRSDLVPLVGHDLACWCPLDQPCHADVLLEIANENATPDVLAQVTTTGKDVET